MADVTQQEAEELADALINAAGALVMNASQMNQSRCADARHRVVEALTRPAPSPSDADLIRRLRGEYRIPITDGLGAAGGEEPDNPNEFVRRFETPPIQHEAADRLEVLARMRGAAVPEGAGTFVQAGHVKFPESREEADAMILVAEAWIKAHQTPAAPEVPR